MKRKSISTLGFILDCLNISTATLARALHVDASLVSKWRTGARHLTIHSIYFDDAVEYIFKESANIEHIYLKDALMELFPHEKINTDNQIKLLLGKAITNTKPYDTGASQHQAFLNCSHNASVMLFEGDSGRADSIRRLLDYADSMEFPGEIIFIDSEEFSWLVDNESFAAEFVNKIILLLQKGFHAKFVIHYSSYKQNFLRFFNACSSLIFHRNVDWYYCEYYDETIFNFSLCILNHSISILGLSETDSNSTTMVFSDTAIVIHHENLAKNVINKCRHLFNYFEPDEMSAVTDNVSGYNKNGAFYSYLPAPAFFCAKDELLHDVLVDNNTDDETIKKCLELNAKLRRTTECYFSHTYPEKEPFIHFFQLEELIARIKNKDFISSSLTILGGKDIKIAPKFYAQELRYLAEGLDKHNNLLIVLVSENDNVSLPKINCWCRRNSWMIQMDDKGFRASEEVSIVNAAAVTLERCMRKVPPERKNKDSVKNILLELADSLDG